MQIIGLTGSIASGKSTAADILRQMGYLLHDADKTVHWLLGPHGPALADIAREFKMDIVPEVGVNRPELGRIIFQEPEKRAALEAILHPMVADDRASFLKQARRSGARSVILDVPLLFETGTDETCDYIITLWAPEFLQIERALARPAMTSEKLAAIISVQWPQSEKTRLSDLALPSGLGKAETRKRLVRFLKRRKLGR